MVAYWDKLEKAERIHLRKLVGSAQQSISFEEWLEKPMRFRWLSARTEVRIDSETEWSIARRSKQYVIGKREIQWCDPMFEPFFGIHTFDQPEIALPDPWARKAADGTDRGLVLVLRSKVDNWAGYKLFVDPKTKLPFAFGSESEAIDVTELQLNSKEDSSWPPLDGYRQVEKLSKKG